MVGAGLGRVVGAKVGIVVGDGGEVVIETGGVGELGMGVGEVDWVGS